MRGLRWRRWWRERGRQQLRVLAIEHWDPLNVYDDPKSADVYDAGRMLRRGKGAEEIARYLGKVRTKAFRRGESETADELFADRVVAWYAVEQPDG